MTKILFVDDEQKILSGLKRSLRLKRGEWDMHFATSGREAIAMLESLGGADVVVSDMRMPEMNGNDLLECVAERWPGASRLILSGYAEHESAVRAAGVAHQFIAKPCNADVLELAVARTCKMRERLSDRSLIEAINGLKSLPTLPASYNAMVAELNNPEPSMARVANVIESDVGMAIKVLQLVNSSYFGLPRHIDNVGQAANLLGLETLRDLAVSTSVFRALDGLVSMRQLEAISSRGQMVAKLVDALSEPAGVEQLTRSELRIAGFIHRVGEIILAALRPEFYRSPERDAEDTLARLAAEEAELGVDHAVVGAYILGVWGLPEGTVQAVYFQNHSRIDQTERNPHSWYLGFASALIDALAQGDELAEGWQDTAASLGVDTTASLELASALLNETTTDTSTETEAASND